VSELQKKPEVVIFAGPNGSGKSTFTELLKPPMDYINADEIKKNLKCSDLEATQLAENQREKHIENMEEFCFETVLSTDRNLKLIKKAKERGYFIRCYYILTADPMINILRVKSRVESGGHDVPEEKIVIRYDRALALVKELVKVCDICHIYDNSGNKPFRIFKKRKDYIYYDECDDWYYEDIKILTDISDMEKRDLNR
jgi:predicted ABC-type ATPase